MKNESQIICLLDACCVINLLHIDEDGKLIRRLSKLQVFLCEEVFKEVNSNVFDKVGKFNRSSGERAEVGFRQIKEEIDTKLSAVRGWQVNNHHITKDFGDKFFDRVAEITGYDKKNGEFFSTALALAISRRDDVKLFFHTDDFPAKAEFAPFFQHQQIGYIEDSADLLVLLHRLDEKFSDNELNQMLSKLASEYYLEVAGLEKKLAQIQFSVRQVKQLKKLREKHAMLIQKLHRHEFNGLSELFDYFFKNKSKCPAIYDLLKRYSSLLDLETTKQINLVEKIKILRKELKVRPVYDCEKLLTA